MKRYHKKVYFPDIEKLTVFNNRLNQLDFQYTLHSLANLKWRAIDLENLLLFIRQLTFNTDDIFEYYTNNNEIEKSCYRIEYNLYDIILVMNKNKVIITIYVNSKNDKHETLNKSLYIQA